VLAGGEWKGSVCRRVVSALESSFFCSARWLFQGAAAYNTRCSLPAGCNSGESVVGFCLAAGADGVWE
jgi:hypothetical protein